MKTRLTKSEDKQASVPGAGVRPFSAQAAPSPRSGNRRAELPERLRHGIERLSGVAMDDVSVHYNSARPAAVDALAFAQGREIHLAPGQERHLPHEAWHVVQQKSGRVRPTLQVAGHAVNDHAGLESEAHAMGHRALSGGFDTAVPSPSAPLAAPASMPLQRQPDSDEEGEKDSSDKEDSSDDEKDKPLSKPGKQEKDEESDEEESSPKEGSKKRAKGDWPDSESDSSSDGFSEEDDGSDSEFSANEEEESEDDEDDEKKPGKKAPINKGATPKAPPVKTKLADGTKHISYETVDGAKHNEVHSKDRLHVVATTSDMQYKLGRAPMDKKAGRYEVFPHWPRSKGQNSTSQMVDSHSSPSSGGMPAAGKYRNSSHASKTLNEAVSAFENPLLQGGKMSKPFSYKTETRYRTIHDLAKDPAYHQDVAATLQPGWDAKRVKERLERVASKYPKSKAIHSEERTLTDHSGTEHKSGPLRDLHAFLPYRAYHPAGMKEYRTSRRVLQWQSGSEGDDSELEDTSAKHPHGAVTSYPQKTKDYKPPATKWVASAADGKKGKGKTKKKKQKTTNG